MILDHRMRFESMLFCFFSSLAPTLQFHEIEIWQRNRFWGVESMEVISSVVFNAVFTMYENFAHLAIIFKAILRDVMYTFFYHTFR